VVQYAKGVFKIFRGE